MVFEDVVSLRWTQALTVHSLSCFVVPYSHWGGFALSTRVGAVRGDAQRERASAQDYSRGNLQQGTTHGRNEIPY